MNGLYTDNAKSLNVASQLAEGLIEKEVKQKKLPLSLLLVQRLID